MHSGLDISGLIKTKKYPALSWFGNHSILSPMVVAIAKLENAIYSVINSCGEEMDLHLSNAIHAKA